MEVVFSKYGWEDYLYWQNNNPNLFKKINFLIKEIKISPIHGIGEVITLKYKWSKYHSRRIDMRHRLVYKVQQNKLYIVQCRYHH